MVIEPSDTTSDTSAGGEPAPHPADAGPPPASGSPIGFVQVLNSLLIGVAPAAALVLMVGAIDYLASRAFFASAYQDSHEAVWKNSLVEDARFFDFSPYDDYSTEVYTSVDIASVWSDLDPLIQSRIWLRSLYPVERSQLEYEETSTTTALKLAKLQKRYATTINPVELYSRAVSSGRPNDFIIFLDSLKECAQRGECKEGVIRDQTTALVLGSHLVPARDLLKNGQCSRASYVTGKAIDILEALDLERGDNNNTSTDAARQMHVLAQHPSCPMHFMSISKMLDEAEYGSLELAEFPKQFPELRIYGVGVALFKDGKIADAYEKFRSLHTSPSRTLSDMAKLMTIRCLFWSVVYANREDLWQQEHGIDARLDSRLIDIDASRASAEMAVINESIHSRSLSSDVDEYQAELIHYMEAVP